MRYLHAILSLPLALAFGWGQEPQLVVGQVHWPGHDLTRAQIRVFRDAERRDLVGAFPALDGTGRCLLPLPEGEYYLMALVDLDGDEKISPGDGLGFHGVLDPGADRPQPLMVTKETFATLIVVSLEMGPERKLTTTGTKPPAPPPPPKWITLRGVISGLGETGAAVVCLVPPEGGTCFAAPVDPAQGAFVADILAGKYRAFVAQDINQDEQIGPGDLVAVAGHEAGQDFPIVGYDDDRADVALALQWTIGPEGLLQARDGGATGPKMDLETLPGVVRGIVPNMPEASPEEDQPAAPTRGLVRACRDAALREQASQGRFRGRQFALALPAGIYFLAVTADVDGDGAASAGDQLGFYGVTDLLKSHGPQPLMLRAGELRGLEVGLVARLNADLKPEPLDTERR